MAHHHETRVLAYTPQQVFALVGDIARYPEFIPWITRMDAGPPSVVGEGVDTLDAEASVGFAFLKEAFGTRVRRDAPALRIDVSLLSGPFKRLENRWLFKPHRLGCEVDFDIDFAFKAKMLDLLLKANFGYAVGRLIACFEGRAAQLYGAPVRPAAPASAPAPSAPRPA